MKKLFIAAALALALSGCATFFGASDQSKFVQAQRVYNSALTQLIEARAPCVTTAYDPDFGPHHPRCLVNDDAYRRIEPIRATADQCLKDADLAIIAGDPSAAVYIACAQGSAAALVDYLIEQ